MERLEEFVIDLNNLVEKHKLRIDYDEFGLDIKDVSHEQSAVAVGIHFFYSERQKKYVLYEYKESNVNA